MLIVETTIKRIIDNKDGLLVSLATNCKVAGKDYLMLVNEDDESTGTCLINNESMFVICEKIKNRLQYVFDNRSKAIFYFEKDGPKVCRNCMKDDCSINCAKAWLNRILVNEAGKVDERANEKVSEKLKEKVNKELIMIGVEMSHE